MKLITFLGAAPANSVVYVMPDGSEAEAPYCGAAISALYPDCDVRVFVTEKADAVHYARFEELVRGRAHSLEKLLIPDGRNDEEMWEIFQIIVDSVAPGETLLFDTTHGLRSLSFLFFLVAAYLRVVKQVQVEGVFYGNYEQRDQSTQPHRAPVLDLISFIGLLDWMVAADRFTRFGDAQDLAAMLDKAAPSNQAAGKQPELRAPRQALLSAANALRDVSRSLRLIRPHEAMQAAHTLQSKMLNAAASIQKQARPFAPLSREVTESYGPLALEPEKIRSSPQAALRTERDMIVWYLRRNQFVQAVALAREWVVSWAMAAAGETDLLARDRRESVEWTLNGIARESQTASAASPSLPELERSVRALPDIRRAATVFQQIGQMRNDLLHAGKNRQPLQSGKLEEKIRNLSTQLDTFRLDG